jgi:hypothetical protein
MFWSVRPSGGTCRAECAGCVPLLAEGHANRASTALVPPRSVRSVQLAGMVQRTGWYRQCAVDSAVRGTRALRDPPTPPRHRVPRACTPFPARDRAQCAREAPTAAPRLSPVRRAAGHAPPGTRARRGPPAPPHLCVPRVSTVWVLLQRALRALRARLATLQASCPRRAAGCAHWARSALGVR